MNKNRIVLAVTNDLVTDQRLHRIAETLFNFGADVLLVGRVLPESITVNNRKYKIKRFKLLFIKGPLFYITFNIRLFFYLLFIKVNVIVSNDLDTLPACFFAALIRFKKLVFDSHELFTEVPELQNRKFIRSLWLTIEKLLVPKLKYAYTVCDSIAEFYKKKYGTSFITIRNLPYKKLVTPDLKKSDDSYDVKIILYQGSVNLGRGIEKIIKSLVYLENVVFIIAGRGDIENDLKTLIKETGVEEKVKFTGVIPYEHLHELTIKAHLGISLEENMGLNYYYALPNKLFDYIQARLPVLVSSFPEMEMIVRSYSIGETTSETDPIKLSVILNSMLNDNNKREKWLKNLEKAAEELVWEKEREILKDFYLNNNLL